jgi:hypothetical protein
MYLPINLNYGGDIFVLAAAKLAPNFMMQALYVDRAPAYNTCIIKLILG